MTHVIVMQLISAAVGGAQFLRVLCASYGGIDWKGMVSPWSTKPMGLYDHGLIC